MREFDIAIVGAGPAGLHAAWKAALLHRTAVLFDAGRETSRIHWSPRVDNLPGQYPVSGRQLLQQARDDLAAYEADYGAFVTVHEATVRQVRRDPGGFIIEADSGSERHTVHARNLIVATGCVDAQPQLADFRRRDIEAVLPYANKGLADYCLLCDGHTVAGKRVAVIGCSPSVRGIAKSLKKNFGAQTVLVPFCNRGDREAGVRDPGGPWEDVQQEMDAEGIPIVFGAIQEFVGIRDDRFGIVFEDGRTEMFDKAWISMGWYKVNNEPALQVGAAVDADGFVRTDRDGRILDGAGQVVPGAYAIGDIVSSGWKQIPIAWGQAEAAVIDCFVSR